MIDKSEQQVTISIGRSEYTGSSAEGVLRHMYEIHEKYEPDQFDSFEGYWNAWRNSVNAPIPDINEPGASQALIDAMIEEKGFRKGEASFLSDKIEEYTGFNPGLSDGAIFASPIVAMGATVGAVAIKNRLTLDPREHMANQLVMRGHATMDELLEASYGEWPPKGLNVDIQNNQRVSLVELMDMDSNKSKDVLDRFREIRDIGGRATLHGDRVIGMNRLLNVTLPRIFGTLNVNSTLGHEGVHILQGDNYYRSGSSPLVTTLYDATDSNANLAVKELLEKYEKPEDENVRLGFKYKSEGIEIQARIHQVLIEGYPKWGQLPTNKEQLIAALNDADFEIPKEVMDSVKNSETWEETQRIFSGSKKSEYYVESIKSVVSRLSDEDKVQFFDKAMPEIYSDLIEMYGDKEGRARFGLGENTRYEAKLKFQEQQKTSLAEDYVNAQQNIAQETMRVSGDKILPQSTDWDSYRAQALDMIKSGQIYELKEEIEDLNKKSTTMRQFAFDFDKEELGEPLYNKFEHIYQSGGIDAVDDLLGARSANRFVDLMEAGKIETRVNDAGQEVRIIKRTDAGTDWMDVQKILKGNDFEFKPVNEYNDNGYIEVHDPDGKINELEKIVDHPGLKILDSPETTPADTVAQAPETKEPEPQNLTDKNTAGTLQTNDAQEPPVEVATEQTNTPEQPTEEIAQKDTTLEPPLDGEEPPPPETEKTAKTEHKPAPEAEKVAKNGPEIDNIPKGAKGINAGVGAAGLGMGAIGLKTAIDADDKTGIAVSGADVAVSSIDLAMDIAGGAGNALKGMVTKANIAVMVVDAGYQISKEKTLDAKIARGSAAAVTTAAAVKIGGMAAAVTTTGAAATVATVVAPIATAITVGIATDQAVEAYKVTEDLERSFERSEQAVKYRDKVESSGAPRLQNYRNLNVYAIEEGKLPDGSSGEDLSFRDKVKIFKNHEFSKDPEALDDLETRLQAKVDHYDKIIEENDSWVHDSVRFFWADDKIDKVRDARIEGATYKAALAEIKLYREELTEHNAEQELIAKNNNEKPETIPNAKQDVEPPETKWEDHFKPKTLASLEGTASNDFATAATNITEQQQYMQTPTETPQNNASAHMV